MIWWAIGMPVEDIELHAPPGENCTFGPKTTWRVGSGYRFEFTADGNLQILNPAGDKVWESDTARSGAQKCSLRPDGVLLLSSAVATIWRANVGSSPGAFLAFQNDGNLVLYSANHEPLWATKTNGK
jgi:hypothetical protein